MVIGWHRCKLGLQACAIEWLAGNTDEAVPGTCGGGNNPCRTQRPKGKAVRRRAEAHRKISGLSQVGPAGLEPATVGL